MNAVDKKAKSFAEMQQDIAVMKVQLQSMDYKMALMLELLIKNYKEF